MIGSSTSFPAVPDGFVTRVASRASDTSPKGGECGGRRAKGEQAMGKAGAERRKYSRIATDQMISFAPVDTRDRLAVSRNISMGGIRFEAVGCEIALGDVLRVTFNVGDHTIVAVGKVVWATDMDPITMDVGLEFIEIDPLSVRLIDETNGE
jgi:hypothetical protein